jgi:hypothetical protein
MTTSIPRITKADRELAKSLGVQAGVVAQMRADGVENIRERLGLGEEAPKPAPVQSIASPDVTFVPLRVLRRCPNPTFVICQSPPPKPVAVQVRVRRNKRLRPGMLIQCRGSGTDWKCVHAGFTPLIQS